MTARILLCRLLLVAAAGAADNPPLPGFNLTGSDPQAMVIADEVMERLGGRRAWQGGVEIANPDTVAARLRHGYEAWINDSYWLVMPYKLKDSGVTLKHGGKGRTEAGAPADILELTFEAVGWRCPRHSAVPPQGADARQSWAAAELKSPIARADIVGIGGSRLKPNWSDARVQISLFPYTSTGTATGPRSPRQDERAVSAAPGRAAASSSSAGPVDLIAAVGSAVAPLSVLVGAASLFPPVDMVGEVSSTNQTGSAAGSDSLPLPGTGEGGAPQEAAEPLAPLGSGGDGTRVEAGDAPILPGSGNRARQPIRVELPGSRPAVERAGDLPPLGAPAAAIPPAPPAVVASAGEMAGGHPALPLSGTSAPISQATAVGYAVKGTPTQSPAGELDGAGAGEGAAAADPNAGGLGATEELTEEEKQVVEELKQRDREVRQHEQAHVAAGGQYVRGGASFEYTTGPDNRRYAVGGEVSIDTSPVPDNPEATIRKAQVVYRAALAPAEPSGQDRSVASEAKQMEGEARRDLAEERREETRETMEAVTGADEAVAAAGAEAGAAQTGEVTASMGAANPAGAGDSQAGPDDMATFGPELGRSAVPAPGAGASSRSGVPGAASEKGGVEPRPPAGLSAEAYAASLLPPTRTASPFSPASAAPVAEAGPIAAIASPVPAASGLGAPTPADRRIADDALAPPELEVDIDVRTRPGVGRLLDVVA